MAEWVKTGDGPTEEWHRLTGDVPEPGTMTLVGIGLATLMIARRKR